MRHLFESYTDYLSSNPGEFTALQLWTATMLGVYIMLIVFRKDMVHGSKGENGFWEPSEQILYIVNWLWPGVVCYAAFFYQTSWIPYFIFGVIAYGLGGKWIFQWFLVFKAGGTEVKDPAVKTVTEKEIETKEKSTETKTDP